MVGTTQDCLVPVALSPPRGPTFYCLPLEARTSARIPSRLTHPGHYKHSVKCQFLTLQVRTGLTTLVQPSGSDVNECTAQRLAQDWASLPPQLILPLADSSDLASSLCCEILRASQAEQVVKFVVHLGDPGQGQAVS